MNRIKVAYLIGSLDTGGAEAQLLELLKNLDRTRFETFLALFDGATAERADGLVKEIYSLRISASANSRWALKSVTVAAGVVRLAAFLRRIRPDIVQAVLPASGILAAAAARFARIPILIGSRRSLVDGYRNTKLLTLVDQKAARRCDLMLGNSEAVARELIEVDGLPAFNVEIIPNGVDTERFRPGDRKERQTYGWAEEHIVFGIIANFIPYKRHVDFVRAAEQVTKLSPNARFVMAGNDRGVVDSLREEIRMRGLGSLFTIIPGTKEPERLYPAMDAYVCTSDTEGLSNVLLEAGASGLPIIATRVGGNPEIVEEGVNGFLVPPRAPESIATAALRIAENACMRREMGAQSRRGVVARFSIQAMVGAHEALYCRLLKSATGLDR